ncbi:Uncharacterised protein [uncultured archaeon]|nr:Uncharacterised protein [uncultured archaeon]
MWPSRRKKSKSILVSTPTHKLKDYCWEDFLNGILDQEIPDGYSVDFLIADNTIDLLDVEYYVKLADRLKGTGIVVTHFGFDNRFSPTIRLTAIYNYIRGYWKAMNHDMLLIVESDVILEKPDYIKKLVETYESENKWWKRLFGKAVGAVTGVTDYTTKKLTKEAIDKLECEGILYLDAGTPKDQDTMIMKELSVDLMKPQDDFQLMPMVLDGKTGWIPVRVPHWRAGGSSVTYRAYHQSEMRFYQKKGAPFEVAGCPLGCILIDGKALNKTTFRFVPGMDNACDVFFAYDIIKAGYKIICDPRVWPEHRHSDPTSTTDDEFKLSPREAAKVRETLETRNG